MINLTLILTPLNSKVFLRWQLEVLLEELALVVVAIHLNYSESIMLLQGALVGDTVAFDMFVLRALEI